MPKLYDDDGNELEVEVDLKDLPSILEKAGKTDELTKSMEEKELELQKLKDKDLNFDKFRNKSEAEKEEIKSKLNAKEKMLMTEIEDMRAERDNERKTALEKHKEKVLDSLTSDSDLKKSIELRVKEFAGEATTPEELEDRLRKSYILEVGSKPTINPINSYAPSNGYTAYKEQKNFVDTPKGKESLNAWFPEIAKKINKE